MSSVVGLVRFGYGTDGSNIAAKRYKDVIDAAYAESEGKGVPAL